MRNPFLYLVLTTWRNSATSRLRRLREPRYLAGAVAGLAYFYFAFFRGRAGGFGGDPGESVGVLQRFGPLLVTAGSLLVWAGAAVRWLLPGRHPFRFTSAEVDLLFTAPVTRRQLVRYKLLRSQAGIVFGVLVALLFAGNVLGPNRPSFLIGAWVLLTTLRFHNAAVSLHRASLAGSGRRRAMLWVPPGIMLALSAATLSDVAATSGGVPSGAPLAERIIGAASDGPAAAMLWPFRALVAPLLAPWPAGFAKEIWPALMLLAGSYLWVLRSDARLEESIMASERERTSGSSSALPVAARRKAPFSLGPRGRVEVAIVWKNLVASGRYMSPQNVIRVALPALVLAAAAGASRTDSGLAELATTAFLALAGGVVVLGPQVARNDLRMDLPMMPVLKTWPLKGESVLAGEILAPALLVTAASWLALAAALLLSAGIPVAGLPAGSRVAAALAAALAVPGLVLLQLVVHNGTAVLFPAWVSVGPSRPRGVEAMGQQMLLFAGVAIVFAVGLLPAAAVAAVVTLVLWSAVGFPALVAGAGLLTAFLGAESWLAVVWLGGVLDRTDAGETGSPSN